MIQLIIASIMGASLGVTITKLTGIGDKVGFKPFNCFAGFTASILAYFLIDRIYR